ncbi:MAG: HAD-IA family hydrolase [Candidatus Omnitrophica bacterium]|nr:HAD-IA family hydrolase [Candidatus Omnitrophota bacterium]
MATTRLLIFDLDGTLVDAYKAVAASINHALAAMGYASLTLADVKRSVGWGERILIAQHVSGDDIDKTLSIFRQHHRAALKTGVRFLPGAKNMLKQLRADGISTAIATNRPTRFTHIILKQLNAADYFDFILCGDKVKNPKPAGDIIQQVLAKFGAAPEEAFYVGDMAIDVQAGHAAGVRTIAVTTGSHQKEDIQPHHPYAMIDHLAEMTEILAKSSLK